MVHLEIKDNTNDKITGNFRYEYFPCLKAINGVLILLYFFFLFGVTILTNFMARKFQLLFEREYCSKQF